MVWRGWDKVKIEIYQSGTGLRRTSAQFYSGITCNHSVTRQRFHAAGAAIGNNICESLYTQQYA